MPFSLLVLAGLGASRWTHPGQPLPFVVPAGWPAPVYDFSKNPSTREGFLLGNRLFFDPILSKDSTISCASCHLNFTAFTHVDHALSHGIYGRIGMRNSLALINLAWSPNLMWDGGVGDLTQQALNPITNPAEMDNTLEAVVAKLNQSEVYKKQFFAAFGDSMVTKARTLQALAQFTVNLVSASSRYDSIMQKNAVVTFTETEARGYALFKSNCASCHTEPLFTNHDFKNNGLPLDSTLMDFGRFNITKRAVDRQKFKVPTLRNIAISQPYFHDGRARNLSQVLDHYTNRAIDSATIAPELRQKITLTRPERKDLIAFLKTLTDPSFLYNNAFRYDFPLQFQH